jgi:hypothetical protein
MRETERVDQRVLAAPWPAGQDLRALPGCSWPWMKKRRAMLTSPVYGASRAGVARIIMRWEIYRWARMRGEVARAAEAGVAMALGRRCLRRRHGDLRARIRSGVLRGGRREGGKGRARASDVLPRRCRSDMRGYMDGR